VIFISFLGTVFLIKEERRPPKARQAARGGWAAIPNKRPVMAMLLTGMLLLLANMSIEPIITVYVEQLVHQADQVTLVSGVVMSAAALGSILSASRLGKLADRVGHWNVVTCGMLVSALLLIPQAFVTASWQLVALRFMMGLSLGGLLPCIAAVIRHNVPDAVAGKTLGYSTSAQYAGQVLGPLAGGFVGGHLGMRSVFLGTSVLMAIGAGFNWWARTNAQRPYGSAELPSRR
jgi:MFS family permease